MHKPVLLPLIAALALLGLPCAGQDPPDAAESEARDTSFLIGVEDVLRIVTWGEADLTMSVKVRPDGMISMPLINEVKVVGLTPEQVRERITEAMKDYVRDPNVTVLVEEINSFRVYFLGEVRTQGPVQFYRPTRLLQGLATAGGLTEFSKKEITVLREEYGVERRIEVNFRKLWSGEPGEENIYLRPGDTVLCK